MFIKITFTLPEPIVVNSVKSFNHLSNNSKFKFNVSLIYQDERVQGTKFAQLMSHLLGQPYCNKTQNDPNYKGTWVFVVHLVFCLGFIV